MKLHKVFSLALLVAGLSTMLYILMIAYFNVLQYDDWVFYKSVTNKGLFGFISDMYLNWQGRYSAFFISGILYLIYDFSNSIFIVSAIQLLVIILSFYFLFRNIFDNLDSFFTISLSLFVSGVFIMSLPEIQSFYWICSSTYITFISLTLFLISVLFDRKTNIKLKYVLLLILSILIGGSAEVYAPLVMIVLFSLLIVRFANKKFSLKSIDSIDKSIVYVLTIIFISFIILLLSPGNEVRLKHSTTTMHPVDITLITKTARVYINFLFLLFSKTFYYILVFPVFYYIGFISNKSLILSKTKTLFPTFIFSIILLLSFLYVSILPGVFAVNDLMPFRALSFISVIMIAFVGFWGYCLGIRKRNSNFIFTLPMSLVFVILLSFYFLFTEYPYMKQYNRDFENRIKRLSVLSQQKETIKLVRVKQIEVKQMNSSYANLWNFTMNLYKPDKMLKYNYFPVYVLELSDDKNNWVNKELKTFLESDFDIIGY